MSPAYLFLPRLPSTADILYAQLYTAGHFYSRPIRNSMSWSSMSHHERTRGRALFLRCRASTTWLSTGARNRRRAFLFLFLSPHVLSPCPRLANRFHIARIMPPAFSWDIAPPPPATALIPARLLMVMCLSDNVPGTCLPAACRAWADVPAMAQGLPWCRGGRPACHGRGVPATTSWRRACTALLFLSCTFFLMFLMVMVS